MPRLVLDANVYVSALLRPEGPPGRIIERAAVGADLTLLLSPAIIDEVLRVFRYPKIRRSLHSGIDPARWFGDLALLADVVAGALDITPVCADPADDKYIVAALEARADALVTGDRELLAVGAYESIPIITPRACLALVVRGPKSFPPS